MEHPLIVPRLRLTRHSPRMKPVSNAAPLAGPSRISPDDYLTVPDDDDDTQSTPRLSALAKLASERNSPVNGTPLQLPADTPAARLRALLARVPNHTPPAASRTYHPPSPSDLESDFEPVNPSPSDTPSIARESLKELFSHALRDPGNTPLKGRRRRNSVDASPGFDTNAERERAYNRGKRASMSDEEADKSSHHLRRDDPSDRPSNAAATFVALRERLSQSSSPSKPPTPSPDQVDTSSSGSEQMDISEDTTAMLKSFDGNISAPPNATSTPMRSMTIPLQMQSQSNLLEQDSGMQRAMRDLDSYDEDTQALQRRLAFPPVRDQMGHTASPSRPLSWSSHSKSHTANNLPLSRRTSEDFDSSSSRASSSMSNAEYQERRAQSEQDRIHHRERAWKPPSKAPTTPGSPERPRHQHSHSSPSHSHAFKPDTPAYSRSRRSSAASMQSLEDGRSSRTSSVSSKSDYRARMKEAEEEKNKERERLWNMPVQARARASSSLGMSSPSDRTRTNSTPSRPDSAQGYISPVRSRPHGLGRKVSASSLSSSSRAGSPARSPGPSINGREDGVEHIRERNWNPPYPKWNPNSSRRSVSPLPESPAAEGSMAMKKMNGSYGSTSQPLSRASPKSRRSLDILPSSPAANHAPSREKSKALEDSITSSPRTTSLAKSPLTKSPPADTSNRRAESTKSFVPSGSVPPSSPSKMPNFKSRFGWQFPRDRASLPPLEIEKDPPPSSPESRPPSPVRPVPSSRIPTTSSSQSVAMSGSGSSPENHTSTVHRKKGHRRSPTEFNEAVGRIPPRIQSQEQEADLPPVPIAQKNEQDSTASPSLSTPLAKGTPLPQDTTSHMAPPAMNGDAPTTQETPPVTPPSSSPPSSATTHLPTYSLSLETPPRMPSFHTSKVEFQTPSPPRNMPDLPGPPSSSENEDEDDRTPVNCSADVLNNLSNMKTPKPPGAWAATPAPSKSVFQRDHIVRPNSTPPTHTPSPLATTPAIRAATLSRAESLPAQTPVPPGAWLATPAVAASSVRRKSILKVRFDIDPGELSDMSMVESTPPPGKAGVPPPPKPIPALNVIRNGSVTDGSVAGEGVIVDVDSTPVKPVKKESPWSPSVRLVDAFGRKTTAAEAPPIRPPSPPPLQQLDYALVPARRAPELHASTPRSKSAIRIVDAMGREVKQEQQREPEEEEETELKVEARRPMRDMRLVRRNVKAVEAQDESDFELMSHNEALARVRATIADLAVDLDEVDRSYDDLALDENRLSALEDASRAARNARNRISDSLRYVQTAEDDLKQKFGSLRKGMNESKFLPSVQTKAGVTWARINTWTVCVFLVIQLVLMALMYRYSSVRTRKMFLTSYYDGFNVDLYLHLTKPELLRHSFPSSFSWSIFTVPDAVSRAGWSGAANELWGNVTSFTADWRGRAWDAWSTSREFNSSWPPT